MHRDIKPANLLLDVQGNLWITDFGLARLQDDAGLTITGDLLGTLRYMSPEQALAKRGYLDHRTDIYSLGATLYELVTLRPAIDGQDRQEVLRKIAQDEPTPPRRLNPAIPRELETILLKAMNKGEILPGGFTMQDLRTICVDWDVRDEISTTTEEEAAPILNDSAPNESADLFDDDADWLMEENPPSKKRKTGPTPIDVIALSHLDIPLDEPEQAVAQIAKRITIDMNDPNILVEELRPDAVLPKPKQTGPRNRENVDTNLTRKLTSRYNISNDQAYDMLKQNHQRQNSEYSW